MIESFEACLGFPLLVSNCGKPAIGEQILECQMQADWVLTHFIYFGLCLLREAVSRKSRSVGGDDGKCVKQRRERERRERKKKTQIGWGLVVVLIID
jgi:hypothetical protein